MLEPIRRRNRFASFAVLCELCVQRISLSRAVSLRKARKVPQSSRSRVVSKEGRPYRYRLEALQSHEELNG